MSARDFASCTGFAWRALSGLLLAAAALAADVVDAAATAPARFERELAAIARAPAAFDYAALARDFHARADRDAAYDAQGVFEEFAAPFAPTDEECAALRGRVADALALAPVSLAAHLVAGACSDDEEVAAGHAAAIRGLIEALRRPLVGRTPLQPWRVFSRWDAEALVHALGYEVRNRSLQLIEHVDLVPMAYLVQAADETWTRVVYVDYFDSYARLIERAGLDAHPLTRMQLLYAFAASGLRAQEPADPATRATDAMLQLQAGLVDAPMARARLLEVRERDRSALTRWWLARCLGKRDDTACPESDIDLLLDDAEFGEPHALALLALLHAGGIAVAADDERAQGLYRRLREVHEPASATRIQASLLLKLPGVAGRSGLVERVLADLVDLRAQHPEALLLLSSYSRLAYPQATALGSPTELADRAFEAGHGPAGLLRVGEWLQDPRDRQRAIERLQAIVADWSQPFAAYTLAQLLRSEARYAEAQPLLAVAARAGQRSAMRLYAQEYLGDDAGDERQAMGRALLVAAWESGDALALIDLVESWRARVPQDRSELDTALQALERLADDSDSPLPRFALGRALFEGLGGERREREGLRLVRKAQKGGHAEAWLYEHQLLVDGRVGRNSARERQRLLDQALIASPSPGVRARVGAAMYADADSDAAQQERGLQLMIAAEEAGRTYVLNDSAWRLCKRGEAARGLALAARAVERRREASTLDTYAACQAASGDYASAVASQAQALELAEGDARHDDARRAGLRKRLAAYREGRSDFSD